MGGDPACSTHGWSILNSAPTNSTLAGVLAGFAFTAAVMYVGRAGPVIDESRTDPRTAARRTAASGMQDVQTISLFTAAFIILGLDSFVWSMVAGSRPLITATEPLEPCGRVWSQAIIAAGMLGLGAIAMVCNITALFLWRQSTVRNAHDRAYLRLFLLIVTAVAVLGVILFAGSDALNYLDVVYHGHIPSLFTAATHIVTFGGLGVAVFTGGASYFRLYFRQHPTEHTKLQNRMKLPTTLIALYALVGAVGVTAAARVREWPLAPNVWITVAYWAVGLIYPVAVVVLVARAIPPAKSR